MGLFIKFKIFFLNKKSSTGEAWKDMKNWYESNSKIHSSNADHIQRLILTPISNLKKEQDKQKENVGFFIKTTR